MGKIIAYRIVAGNAAHEVTEEVNNLLEAGWELYGELKVTSHFSKWGSGDDEQSQDVYGYDQAMVQREPDEPNEFVMG